MKFINKFLIGLIVVGGVTSCQDYLDINESPIDPTQDAVAPDLLLAGALSDMVQEDQRGFESSIFISGNEAGNVFMYNWGADVQNVAGGFLEEFTLVFNTTYRDEVWDGTYQDLSTSQSILNYPSEVYDNYKAIARINKAYYFQYLVDLYGDIPYFDALKGGAELTPSYDDAKDIYRDLIVELDMAIDEINNADDLDVVVGAQDVVFGGDMEKWIQFANTLKLRILMRQATLAETDGGTQTYLTEQFANLDNNFLTSSATLNPGYADATGKQNPFYANYGFDAEGTPTFNYNFITATSYAALFLQGDQTLNGVQTGVFDLRVNQIYEPLASTGTVVGMQQGSTSDTAPEVLSELGDGIIKSSSQDIYLFPASSSFFLQAEAAFRGYISGNPKDLFQQGIIASFLRLGLSATDAQGYITASNGTNLIGWDGSTNKIEAIMTQKWIALNSINGLESWIEYNRTGFPVLPLPITATKDSRPNRLPYPASEYSNNSANVPVQSNDAIFNTKIFWDVN